MTNPVDNSLFEGIDRSTIHELLVEVPQRRVQRGDVLFDAGDIGDELFLVLSGTLQASLEQVGEFLPLATYRPGEFFGELAILGGDTRSATVEAVEDSVVLPISRSLFATIAERYPRVADNVTRAVVQRLIRTTQSLGREGQSALTIVVVVADSMSREQLRYVLDAAGAIHGRLCVVTGESWGRLSTVLDTSTAIDDDDREHHRTRWYHLAASDTRSPSTAEQGRADGGVAHIERILRGRGRGQVIVVVPHCDAASITRLRSLASRVFIVTDRDTVGRIPSDLLVDASSIVAQRPPIELVGVADTSTERRELASAAFARGLPLPSLFVQSRQHRPDTYLQFSGRDLASPDPVLQQGLLRLARAIAGTRIGLAFGAGGARGFAHIGALRFLEEHRVPVDAIAGSSIGSLVGAMYALGLNTEAGTALLHQWLQGGYRKLLRLRPSTVSIFSGEGLERVCYALFGDTRFIDLPTPLAVIVSDLVSGAGATMTGGPVYRAVQASCSIPAIFPPVRLADRLLVDGGVTDPLPVRTLRQLRAEKSIALNISFSADDLRQWSVTEGGQPPERLLSANRLPSLIEAYHASFSMSIADKAIESAAMADVTIRPRFRVTSWRAFTEAPEQIQRGYDAAVEAERALRTVIPWLVPRDSTP